MTTEVYAPLNVALPTYQDPVFEVDFVSDGGFNYVMITTESDFEYSPYSLYRISFDLSPEVEIALPTSTMSSTARYSRPGEYVVGEVDPNAATDYFFYGRIPDVPSRTEVTVNALTITGVDTFQDEEVELQVTTDPSFELLARDSATVFNDVTLTADEHGILKLDVDVEDANGIDHVFAYINSAQIRISTLHLIDLDLEGATSGVGSLYLEPREVDISSYSRLIGEEVQITVGVVDSEGYRMLDYPITTTLTADNFLPETSFAGSTGNETATVGSETIGAMAVGRAGNDRLEGNAQSDTIWGGEGTDTLIGNGGDDFIYGGGSAYHGDNNEIDLRDLIYGGDGNDFIDGGYGNDELNGDAGNDTVAGGFGADTVIGGDGDDQLTGSAWGDVIFGGAGADFINGGFGFDRVNGGDDGDRFFHLGIADHGSDWIQDYDAAEGDVLQFGAAASASDFQVNFTETANAGVAGVEEAFVIYRPTGQIMWALVDGGAQTEINILIGGTEYDLLV